MTDHFTVPADACATFKRTYQLLEEFINDVFVHIFCKEDRLFYDLERIWRDGKTFVDVEEL